MQDDLDRKAEKIKEIKALREKAILDKKQRELPGWTF